MVVTVPSALASATSLSIALTTGAEVAAGALVAAGAAVGAGASVATGAGLAPPQAVRTSARTTARALTSCAVFLDVISSSPCSEGCLMREMRFIVSLFGRLSPPCQMSHAIQNNNRLWVSCVKRNKGQ